MNLSENNTIRDTIWRGGTYISFVRIFFFFPFLRKPKKGCSVRLTLCTCEILAWYSSWYWCNPLAFAEKSSRSKQRGDAGKAHRPAGRKAQAWRPGASSDTRPALLSPHAQMPHVSFGTLSTAHRITPRWCHSYTQTHIFTTSAFVARQAAQCSPPPFIFFCFVFFLCCLWYARAIVRALG